MSLLLLQIHQFDSIILNHYQPHSHPTQHSKYTQILPKQNQYNLASSSKKVEILSENIQEDDRHLLFTYLIGHHNSKYKNAIKVKMGKQHQGVRMAMNIVNESETYFKVGNPHSLTNLLLKINSLAMENKLEAIKLCCNIHNGMIQLHFPLFFIPFQPQYHNTIVKPPIQLLYKNYMQSIIPMLDFLVKSTNNEVPDFTSNLGKHKIYSNIKRYTQVLHTSSEISQFGGKLGQKQKMRREQIHQLIKNKVRVEQDLSRSIELYKPKDQCNRNYLSQNDYILNEEEAKKLRTLLTPPISNKPKNNLDNTMNFNYIYVHNLLNLNQTMIDYGGFSTIFQSEIKYTCVYPTEGYDLPKPTLQQQLDEGKLISKRVVIKKQDQNCGFSRNQHQIQILKKLKNNSTVFLPKYYFIVNKPNPLQKSVVMDYIPTQNLKAYMRSHFKLMSLSTKLHIILSIIHSLRFLQDMRIVHLDLKPNNIMIYRHMIVKLIDFGQSFHEEVCNKRSFSFSNLSSGYSPGFTIPYSPPEVYHKKRRSYTSKSDVFSLGVIMFEVLYNFYPFDMLDTEAADEFMELYLERWYFSPEGYQTFGDIALMRILNYTISKCLNIDPDERPHLDWLAAVIRSSLELLN